MIRSYLLADNFKQIMIYCDIDSLKNINSTCTAMRKICDMHFWLDKFTFDELEIIQHRDNYIDWIHEYDMIIESKSHSHNLLNIALYFETKYDRVTCVNICNYIRYKDIKFLMTEIIDMIETKKGGKY